MECKVGYLGNCDKDFSSKMGKHRLETSEEQRDPGLLVNQGITITRSCDAVVTKANAILGCIWQCMR